MKMKRNQKVEDYIESRLDELQERFRKLYTDTDRAALSMLIRELRHIKTMITIEGALCQAEHGDCTG